jgi:hypothetical protein
LTFGQFMVAFVLGALAWHVACSVFPKERC